MNEAMTAKITRHKEICETLNDTYARKNHDYGDSFGESYHKLGIISAITRLTDKMNRATTLALNNDPQVKDEKLEDTLLDLANYAIMTVIEMEKGTSSCQKPSEPAPNFTSCEGYGECTSCYHWKDCQQEWDDTKDKTENAYCLDCQNNFVPNTKEYEEAPLKWEPDDMALDCCECKYDEESSKPQYWDEVHETSTHPICANCRYNIPYNSPKHDYAKVLWTPKEQESKNK